MNRGELVIKIAGYLHRDNMQTDIEGFVDLATARIGRDLRSQFNTTIDSAFLPDDAFFALPSDYRNMSDLSHVSGRNRISLVSRSVTAIRQYNDSGSTPLAYNVFGLTIEIRPFQAKEFRLSYYAEPQALVNDADENDVLTAYPYLYIYAGLVEAHFFNRNEEARLSALSTYTSEIKEVNQQTRRANAGARPSVR